jgi:hypothetical protein
MRTIVAVASLLLAFASPSRALFHLAAIEEVNAAVGGDSNEQYVEIRMYEISQNFVQNSRLTAFDCDGSTVTPLLVVPAQLPNGGADVAWIMATSSAATGGITPDFIFPAGLDDTCGMVCWGSPSAGVPLDPDSWDITDPANYTDCVAYGGYSGPTAAGSGTPSALPPGDGTDSLTYTGTPSCTLFDCTGNNATDFTLACPSPENNAGEVGDPGDCLANEVDVGVLGTKLIIVDKDAINGSAKLVYVSKGDPNAQKGPGVADPPAPADISGRFDVVFDDSSASGAFDLPGAGWLVNKATVAKYVNRDAPTAGGAVKVAIVKPGKLAKVVAKDLGDTQDVDLFALPTTFDGPVTTVYEVTNTAPGGSPFGDVVRMCTRFSAADGSTVIFKELGAGGAGRKLVMKNGVAAPCP